MQCHESFPIFENCIELALTFRYLICFELIFIYGLKVWFYSFVLDSPLSQYHCLKSMSFSPRRSHITQWKSFKWQFLSETFFLFDSLCVCHCTSGALLWLPEPRSRSSNHKCVLSHFSVIFQDCFDSLGVHITALHNVPLNVCTLNLLVGYV